MVRSPQDEPAQRQLSTCQLAALWGVSRATVLKWIDQGRLYAAVLPNRRYRRVPPAEALAFALAHGLPAEELARLAGRSPLPLASVLLASSLRVLPDGLASAGRLLSVATDLPQAVAHLARRHYHALILDAALAGGAGQLLAWVREAGLSTRVGVLALEDDRRPHGWLERGADRVVKKPADVLGLVRQLLARGASP